MGQRGDGLNHIFDENLTIRKNCTASKFIGDGSQLTGIASYWDRVGTTISPENAGDNLDLKGSSISSGARILNCNAISGVEVEGETQLFVNGDWVYFNADAYIPTLYTHEIIGLSPITFANEIDMQNHFIKGAQYYAGQGDIKLFPNNGTLFSQGLGVSVNDGDCLLYANSGMGTIAFNGTVDMRSHTLIGVPDPTSDQHAATKKYVDDEISGIPSPSLAFADLTDYPADAAGSLTNDGSGNLSWSASGGATTALDNLASVAINVSLISDTDDTDDLGSSSKEWKDLYVDGIAYVDDLRIDNHAYFNAEIDNGNSGASDTIDWGAGNKQKTTLTDNCTFTFTAPDGVGNFLLKVVQDGTGSRVPVYPATVKWPGGTKPTLSTAANSVDILTFYWDGTNYFGVASLAFAVPA